MTILVTGASGTVGSSMVRQLHEAGLPVRALSRNPGRVRFPAGVDVREGDLERPETVAPALEGVNGLHLIQIGGDDYRLLETAPRLLELARAAGVSHVALLGGGGEEAVEQAVQAGGIDWTLLRPHEFMANTLEWAESIREESLVRAPFSQWRSAMIHEDDIAAVSVAALTQAGHAGQIYTLTGPEPVLRVDAVRTIATALGREIGFEELTVAQARTWYLSQGYPADVVDWLLDLGDDPHGAMAEVSPDVERVLGRPGLGFARWAGHNVEKFR